MIKGGGSFDQKYFYFRSADNDGKMALNQDGDLQWSIAETAAYDVTANTLTDDLTIVPAGLSAITAVDADTDAPAEYFDLQGRPVAEPDEAGIYIVRRAGKVTKVYVK